MSNRNSQLQDTWPTVSKGRLCAVMMVATRYLMDSVATICSFSHVLTCPPVTPSQLPRMFVRSRPSVSSENTGPIENSSSLFPGQSVGSSAPSQSVPMEMTIPNAEQHELDLQHTTGIMSGNSPGTRTNKPLIPTPTRTPRPINLSAADMLPASFQSDPSRSEASTGDGMNSPMIATSFGMLSGPTDLLHVVTETGPPTISFKSFKTFAIPSIIRVTDKTLLGSNMNTVSSLGWTVSLKSDHSLLTGWNVHKTDTLPLGFNPATTPAPLAEALPTPETNIIPSSSAAQSSLNRESSLNQETGSTAHIESLQVEDSSQSLSTSTPTQTVESLSSSWQYIVPVVKTQAKPLITPLPSGREDNDYSGEPLTVSTERQKVPIGFSTPTVVHEHSESNLVLLSSNTPSSRSSNSAKTEGLNDSGSSTTRPARPMNENRVTSTSINMVPDNTVATTGMSTAPDGPDRRLSTTNTASNTATRSIDNDSVFDQLQRSQPISRQSLKISAGAASVGTAIFILTFVLHRFVYQWADRRRTGVIWIGHEQNANTDSGIELLPRISHDPEISYFSDGS